MAESYQQTTINNDKLVLMIYGNELYCSIIWRDTTNVISLNLAGPKQYNQIIKK